MQTPFEQHEFVLLLTGASKGLGRAIARAWARPGARIAIAARGGEALEEVRLELERRGASVFALAGDVGRDDFAQAFARGAERTLGPATHLVTCASSLGAVPLRPIADHEDASWREAVATNLLGTVRLWREVLPKMEGELGGGRIVHISSDAALEAYPHWGPYAATKAAVDHLVRILAEELREHRIPNVFAYAVDPGDMDTDMHRAAIPDADPAQLLQPQDVAPQILDLLLRRPALPSGRLRAQDIAGASR